MSDQITPFRIAIPNEQLEDLKRRLRATRWPERECVDDWTQGLPLAYAQEVASYWLEKYDWRAREALLNRFPQFKTQIDGLGIHFVHVRSPHPDATPLLVTHGWPGSIVEFQKVIEPLTNPTAHGGEAADAFHVVCPSLPGYGFSDKPTRTGWNVQRIAKAWSELMLRLGYKRYAAQGGDWGAAVTTCIGFQDPANCLGIHVNLPLVLHLLVRIDPSSSDLTMTEKSAFAGFRYYNDWDSGYSKEQSTRPQTVGYGLKRPRPNRPDGLDPREVLGMDRLWRPSGERPDPRRTARQCNDVLADRKRRLVCATLLGKFPLDPNRRGPDSCGMFDLPQGDLPRGVAAAGWSNAIRNWSTSTSSTRAATSPHSNSRKCSCMSCAHAFGRSGKQRDRTRHGDREWPHGMS